MQAPETESWTQNSPTQLAPAYPHPLPGSPLTPSDKYNTQYSLDLQIMQETEESDLLIKCMSLTERIPVLVFHNKAKIANLNDLTLLLEIVESWIFDNKKTSQKNYELESSKFFKSNSIVKVELLIDVEDGQVKIINLLKNGDCLVVENVQDFRILRVILNRSRIYLGEILRLDEMSYYNS